ncbi:MAG TPA: cytochrome c [Devosiaceae bacterium]|jgi:mono/diheme cytochrome c family protein
MKKGLLAGLVAMLSVGVIASGAALAQESLDAQMKPLMTEGKTVFADNCAVCHGDNGEGNVGPKLDGNEWIKTRANIINQVLFGATDHGMPPFAPELTDEQIAAVTTYVRNSWSNNYGIILPRSIELRRKEAEEEKK